MCLVLLHHRTRADWPLVVLANRDESYDRPFEPPALRDEARGVVAPRDLRAGGTWLGVNAAGLVAAITNRRGEEAPAGTRSRGLLVWDALARGSAREATDWVMRHLAAQDYGGFHLLLADRRDAFVVRYVRWPPRAIDRLTLPPGAHVLTNLHELDELTVPPGGEPDASEPIELLLARLERVAADPRPSLPGGHRILKRERDRGTVCSATLAVPSDGRGATVFRFASGPPDTTPFLPAPAPATRP